MRLTLYISVICGIFFFTSCKTMKVGLGTKESGKLFSNSSKLARTDIRTANFNNINISLNLNGMSFNSKASMRIVTDSIIQLSIQPILGIEVARINFTKDEVLAIDKINQRYIRVPYDSLFASYDLQVAFSDLQALFLNKLFMVSASNPDSLMQRFKTSSFPEGVLLKEKSSYKGVSTEFIVDKKENLSMASVIFPNAILQCNYSAFEKQDNVLFPSLMKIQFIQGPKIGGGEISVKNVEFNKKIRISQVDLSNYTELLKIEQIIPN